MNDETYIGHINEEVVWGTCAEDLPSLKKQIKEYEKETF